MKRCKLFGWIFGLMIFALTCSARAAEAADGKGDPRWEAWEQEAVSVLSQYLQVDTTNPPGNETRAAEFLKAIFDREGIEARIIESAPGRGNIYARLKGDGSKKAVILLNHLDVVPADKRYWTQDPFSGVIKDGYIWGRGAIDTKGMAVTELMTMLALKRQGVPLKGDVIFLGTADEEAGGAMGAGFITREHFDLFDGAGVVLNEGGFIYEKDGKVQYYGVVPSEKAPFWLKLTATGTPGHGSVPLPDSAVNRLIGALHRIIAYQAPLQVLPEVQKFYADIAQFAPPSQQERLKDLKKSLQDPAFAAEFTKNPVANARVRNTISVTVLQGSNKTNVIPPQASAELDVRLLPGAHPEAFLQEFNKVIADENIKVEPLLSFATGSSPTDSDLYRVVSEVAKIRDPGSVVTTPLPTGFTDCHFFRDKAIPCYDFWPFKLSDKDLALIHGNDERISVENVKFGTRLVYDIVQKLAVE